MPLRDYLELMDASARLVRADKSGSTLADVAPIFERLNLEVGYWKSQIKDFGRLLLRQDLSDRTMIEVSDRIADNRHGHLGFHTSDAGSAPQYTTGKEPAAEPVRFWEVR